MKNGTEGQRNGGTPECLNAGILKWQPPKSGLVKLRVRKKFAFLFCGTKGLGECIINPFFLKLLAFRHTPK